MQDKSHLDRKYFIDDTVFNCPFCNRNNVPYIIYSREGFSWSLDRECYIFVVRCKSCGKRSMHLTFHADLTYELRAVYYMNSEIEDIDSKIFFSQPTSFFTLDARIFRTIRELISEAEGCLKMNYLTGASACVRKAIYELLIKEKMEGKDYKSRIKSLKDEYPGVEPDYFDILAHIQDMTSDKIHEQSWDKWDSTNLKLIIETLKGILHDIYVLPAEKAERSKEIKDMRAAIIKDKRDEESVTEQPPRTNS